MSRLTTKPEFKAQSQETNDPVLHMLGVGSELWQRESGDRFVERLRSEDLPPSSFEGPAETVAENLLESIWHRIESHQGQQFKTATQLPFTYTVEGLGIWFFRNGQRVNRKLSRVQVNKAIARCPLASTTEIKDLMDYPYLFALLMDPRIRHEAW